LAVRVVAGRLTALAIFFVLLTAALAPRADAQLVNLSCKTSVDCHIAQAVEFVCAQQPPVTVENPGFGQCGTATNCVASDPEPSCREYVYNAVWKILGAENCSGSPMFCDPIGTTCEGDCAELVLEKARNYVQCSKENGSQECDLALEALVEDAMEAVCTSFESSVEPCGSEGPCTTTVECVDKVMAALNDPICVMNDQLECFPSVIATVWIVVGLAGVPGGLVDSAAYALECDSVSLLADAFGCVNNVSALAEETATSAVFGAESPEILEELLSEPYDPDAGDTWPPVGMPVSNPPAPKQQTADGLPLAQYRTELTSLPVEKYAALRRETYGGLHVSPDGKSLVSLWTNNAEQHQAKLQALTPIPLKVRTVKHSLVELDRLVAQVDTDAAALRKRGTHVTTVGTDLERNVVDLGVAGLTAERRHWLIQKYGPAVSPRDTKVVPMNSRGIYQPTLFGGLRLKNAFNLAGCTSAFKVRFRNKPGTYLSTAAHCGEADDPYLQGDGYVGDATLWFYQDAADATFILNESARSIASKVT
jgi:hypothetical protein